MTLAATLNRIERTIIVAALVTGCAALCLAVLAGTWQVIARFILFRSAAWSEPFIQISLIWMTYLGLGAAIRSGSLIAVDLLIRLGTPTTRRFIRAVGALATFLLLAVLFWFGIELVSRVRFQTIAGLNISASWAYLALPVGASVSMIALLAHLMDPAGRPDPDVRTD
jgi:TRAP-type C4-dicarboxylate transport system permease small subunit